MLKMKGRSIIWAKIRAGIYALRNGQFMYTEQTKTGAGMIYYRTDLVGTCTGSFATNDIEIKKVFYERVKK